MVNSENISTRHRDSKNFSSDYLVYIKSSKQNTAVVSRAPEELNMQLTSDWDTPLSQGGSSGIVEIGLQEVFNLSSKTQFASAQIWSGTSPITITLPLEFQAEDNPRREVLEPIIRLTKMALPSLSGTGGDKGLFSPPGPRIFRNLIKNENLKDDRIVIQLGNFILFNNVIITEVSPTFNTRDMGKDGVPIRAKCDVTFRTVFSLTGTDFERMFPL